MAKAAMKSPVAGQPGYNPFSDTPVEEQPERAPQPVQQRQHKSSADIAMKKAADILAKDMIEWLAETGTNPEKLRAAKEWLMGVPSDPAPSGEALFRFLEFATPPTAQGTLRKAGKRLWGSEWELEAAVLESPLEEIGKLRGQIANLEGQQAARTADLTGTKQQNAMLETRLAKMQQQLDFLKLRAKPEDIIAAGIDRGENVLTRSDLMV
jgi:cell division protein FtsB